MSADYLELDEGQSKNIASLLELSPDLIAVFDAQDRLESANPSYCKAFHCTPEDHPTWREVMRANYDNGRGPVIETKNIDSWLTIATARRGTVPYRSFEAAFHDGKWIWATETVSSLGHMLYFGTDISSLRSGSRALRVERDAARRASWTDELTGVPNRRYTMERLELWLNEQREKKNFGAHTLAILDLDHFKRINDRFGHSTGDAVLVSFCRDVLDNIRALDLFGRIGGEEFLLFMPNCALEIARDRLELLQCKVGQSIVDTQDDALHYTFSAGLIEFRPAEGIDDALRRADRLLYDAKTAGRARAFG